MNLNILLLILCISTNLPNHENEQKNLIIGKWQMCVSQYRGLEQRTNHCPIINFLEDGTGTAEDFSKFRWTVTDNLIQFSFPTIKDEQDFISPDTDLVYKIYTENNGRYLKLSNEKTDSWYLLARISQ